MSHPDSSTEGSAVPASPSGWHPDPYRRFEMRYYDGTRWTEHVSSRGIASIDPSPLDGRGVVQSVTDIVDRPIFEKPPQEIAQQAASVVGYQTGNQPFQGGGTLFDEPVLVVNQKAKIIEVNNEYGIFDQSGQRIGGVTQVGQSAAKKVMRILTSYDQFMTHKLVLHDAQGIPLLYLTRPAKVFKSTIVVSDATGGEVGRIIQENVFGKIRFALQSGGQRCGSINAQNWVAWDFSIEDHAGVEVAKITKKWAGLAQAMFTTADNYVVQFHRKLENPLLSLAVAAAVSVDTALKQDSRGLG